MNPVDVTSYNVHNTGIYYTHYYATTKQVFHIGITAILEKKKLCTSSFHSQSICIWDVLYCACLYARINGWMSVYEYECEYESMWIVWQAVIWKRFFLAHGFFCIGKMAFSHYIKRIRNHNNIWLLRILFSQYLSIDVLYRFVPMCFLHNSIYKVLWSRDFPFFYENNNNNV